MPTINGINVELDSPAGPFGMGVGHSTVSYFKCAFCGEEYNKPPEGEDEDEWTGDEYVRFFDFGPLVIGECCFTRLEEAVNPLVLQIVSWKVAKAEHREDAARYDLDTARQAAEMLKTTDG